MVDVVCSGCGRVFGDDGSLLCVQCRRGGVTFRWLKKCSVCGVVTNKGSLSCGHCGKFFVGEEK